MENHIFRVKLGAALANSGLIREIHTSYMKTNTYGLWLLWGLDDLFSSYICPISGYIDLILLSKYFLYVVISLNPILTCLYWNHTNFSQKLANYHELWCLVHLFILSKELICLRNIVTTIWYCFDHSLTCR